MSGIQRVKSNDLADYSNTGLFQFGLQTVKVFLTGRKQCVKIGKSISEKIELQSGVPQGGILSPISFTIYCADIKERLISS